MNKNFFFLFVLLISCTQEKGSESLFELIEPTKSGIDFKNELTYDQEFNVYTYRNYYNGGGVSIGDVNNDGLPDIYMTANLTSNKLYLKTHSKQ